MPSFPNNLKRASINSVYPQSSQNGYVSLTRDASTSKDVSNWIEPADVNEINNAVTDSAGWMPTFVSQINSLEEVFNLPELNDLEKLWLKQQLRDSGFVNKTLFELLINRTLEDTENIRQNLSSDVTPTINLSDEALILVPLYATIFLLSMVGNSLVMVTLLQNKRMRTPTNVLLLNLAISDILLGVVCMPFTLTGFLLRDFVFGAVLCRVIPYLQAVSVSVSAYTLVTISLERYFGICFPLKTRHWRSLSHSYKMISVVWVASFLFTAPIAVTSTLRQTNSGRHKCREVWPSLIGEQIFSIFLDITLLVLPLVLMMTVYSRMCQALWVHIKNERVTNEHPTEVRKSTGEAVLLAVPAKRYSIKKIYSNPWSKNDGDFEHEDPDTGNIRDGPLGEPKTRIEGCVVHSPPRREGSKLRQPRKKEFIERNILRKTNTKKSLENKKRVIKMLVVVVLEFFVCWTPLYVINTVSVFSPALVYRTVGMGGVLAFQLLAFCSSCCNPITYCFMNASFRKAFLSAMGCKKDSTTTFHCEELQMYSRK